MNPTPTCRHLHTDGRPCGSPALRGQPFCFHHHAARQPMPKRADLTADPRHLRACPQLPAPDDFPAIQRAVGEVLRLLVNDYLTDARAATLLRGLAIASQNLARLHRREEKLAAAGLLHAPVTEFVNDPQHGTLAPETSIEVASPTAIGCPTEVASSTETGCPTEFGCPTFATVSPSLRWASDADPLPQPIPVLTPDPSPHTSYDQAREIEINAYFQAIDDKRRERSQAFLARREQELELELEARYEDRLQEATRDLEARLATQLATQLETRRTPIPIQQNQDLSQHEELKYAFAS